MVGSEVEMLREADELGLGERAAFESSRQAEYEDSVPPEAGWDAGYDDE